MNTITNVPYKQGQKVLVQINYSAENKTVWQDATFVRLVSALDRDYRVTVRLDETGVEIDECAPECVKTMDNHFKKYENLYNEKGEGLLHFVPFSKEDIEAALNNGDEHLNTLPLRQWDMSAAWVGWTYKQNGKAYASLAEQVCLLKHIAKYHIANN